MGGCSPRARGRNCSGIGPGSVPTASPLVAGRQWTDDGLAALERESPGTGAHLVWYDGPERFDVLPLLVARDGAIAAVGYDRRRLRPNIVIGGVPGLAERGWEGKRIRVGRGRGPMIGIGDLRR